MNNVDPKKTVEEKKTDVISNAKEIHAKLKKHFTIEMKTNILFGFSAVFFLVIIFFVLIPGVLGVYETKAHIITLNEEIDGSFEYGEGLTVKLVNIGREIELERERIAEKNEKIKSVLDKIVPEKEDIHMIVKILEDFSVRYHTMEEPLLIKNIRFKPQNGGAKGQEGFGEFVPIPFQLTIDATEKSFHRFLSFIEKSGSLNPNHFFQKQPVRLLSVSSIKVPLEKLKEDEKSKTYNMTLLAFYRPIVENAKVPPSKGGDATNTTNTDASSSPTP